MKPCAILVVLVTAALSCAAQVSVPDAALEAVLREAVEQPEGPLDRARLAALTALDAPRRGIVSLAGLEVCTGLERIDLAMNRIANLAPLAGLTALRQLVLARNGVTDLAPLTGLPALTDLDLSANHVIDLAPLAGLAALERLALRDNRVGDVTPLRGLARLESLSLERNPVRDAAPLAGLTSLASLGLAQTRVADGAFLAGLPALRQVSTRNCPLSQHTLCEVLPALAARGVKADAPEGCGEDADGDGLSDAYETRTGSDPAVADTDGDGLEDGAEAALGTDPAKADTDGDGLPDAWEAAHGLRPLEDDAGADPDGDGASNAMEREYGTAPNDPADYPGPAVLKVDVDAVTLRPDHTFGVFDIAQTGDVRLEWAVESSDYRIWVTDPPAPPGQLEEAARMPVGMGFNPALYDRVEAGTGPRTLAIRTDAFNEAVEAVVTVTNTAEPSQRAVIRVVREAEEPEAAPEAAADTVALTVVASPEAAGRVFLEPSGGRYAPGTAVGLGAVAAEGYAFDHWQGPVSDASAATTTVTVSEDTAVVAHFTEARGAFGCAPASRGRGWGDGLVVALAALALWRRSRRTTPSAAAATRRS